MCFFFLFCSEVSNIEDLLCLVLILSYKELNFLCSHKFRLLGRVRKFDCT